MKVAKSALDPDRIQLEKMEARAAEMGKECEEARHSMNAIVKQSDALTKKFATAQEKFDEAVDDQVCSLAIKIPSTHFSYQLAELDCIIIVHVLTP